MAQVWKDIAEKLNLDENLLKQRNYAVFGERAVVIEGHKSLASVGEKEISFYYGDGLLTVYGDELQIKALSKGYAAVTGKISKVEKA